MSAEPVRSASRRELAYRFSDALEVTLFWLPATDELKVCVDDHRQGAYFEIGPEPHLALEVYHHPYAYLDFCDVYLEDMRLAS